MYSAPIRTTAATKKWLRDFGIELYMTVVSIEFYPIENLWAILAKKVYDQEKPPIENIVELGKRRIFRTKHRVI